MQRARPPEWVAGIGKALRVYHDDIIGDPLPRRWVDLIRHLNERERRPSRRWQPETEPRERSD
jgi:hypothetical protein